MSKSDSLTDGLAKALAKLAACRAATPFAFFQAATQFVQAVSEQIESPIMLGVFTPTGKMVLPLWAAPESMLSAAAEHVGYRNWESGDVDRLNGLISLMLLQKFRLGSAADVVEVSETNTNSSTKWLFPTLCRSWEGHLVHVRRKTGPNELGDLTVEAQKESLKQCLRRNLYTCALFEQPKENREYTAYTPWFGNVPLDFDPLNEALTAAFLHPRQVNPGWDTFSVCFFPVLGAKYLRFLMPDAKALAKRIQPVLPYLTTACASVVHELQMQVTSGNPRYSSRYFQIVFGKAVLELLGAVNRGEILPKSMLGILIREAATSLFDGRTHPIAAWRLSRELQLKKHAQAYAAFNSFGLQPRLRPWAKPVENEMEIAAPTILRQASRSSRETRIVVTGSPRGGVGKTFLTYNLARRLAARSQRVLLIELDAANPTLYFLDSQYRQKVHDLPEFKQLVQLGMDPAAAVRAEAAVVGRDGTIRDELKRWTCTLDQAGIDVLGAIPGVKNVVDWLAYDSAHQEDKKQVNALFHALKAETLYDWVLVDTAAGFRDLSNAVLSSEFVDLILACALPTKPALLSSLVGLEVLRREGVETKCLLVLNQCRDMDSELFRDKASIEDFVWYWVNNGGSDAVKRSVDVGVIPGRKLVDQVLRLSACCLVEWDQIAARLEVDRDWIDILENDFGMNHLAEAIAREVGVYLPAEPSAGARHFELIGEETRR